jgi:hypothetical protein
LLLHLDNVRMASAVAPACHLIFNCRTDQITSESLKRSQRSHVTEAQTASVDLSIY